ncbi:glycosyltransferase [Streptomyces niveiscabiei]|uniref:Glycosyltransferase n=1 Tax=Streptomyces niveiscabiei TaxID=164115 RepID=A0ABW9HJU3_9ACTN
MANTVGAVPEMITDGREGLLVSPAGSPQALRDALLKALHEPDAAATRAERAREAARTRFAPEREVRELTAVYEACRPPLTLPARRGAPSGTALTGR